MYGYASVSPTVDVLSFHKLLCQLGRQKVLHHATIWQYMYMKRLQRTNKKKNQWCLNRFILFPKYIYIYIFCRRLIRRTYDVGRVRPYICCCCPWVCISYFIHTYCFLFHSHLSILAVFWLQLLYRYKFPFVEVRIRFQLHQNRNKLRSMKSN